MANEKTEQIPKQGELWSPAPNKDMQRLDDLNLGNLGIGEGRVFLAQGGKKCLDF